jgi:hypothetical protein
VIQAAGRYTKVEDAIFQALSDIPEILERSRRYVTIYANLREHALEKRTYELFRSILRTLCHIMRFFKEGTLRKRTSVSFVTASTICVVLYLRSVHTVFVVF